MTDQNNLNFSLDSLSDSGSSSGDFSNGWSSLNVNDSSSWVISFEDDPQEKEAKTISHKIRLFVISSIIVILDLLVGAIFFAYNFYNSEVSKAKPNTQYAVFFEKYNQFFDFIETYLWPYLSSYFPSLNKQTYKNLPLISQENEGNFTRIINSTELSYTEKKNLIEPKLNMIISNTNNKLDALEEINSQIVKNYFLPQEIRDILWEKGTTDLQRALSSLEIIKFNTASKVFIYLDSIMKILTDKTGIPKENIETLLKKITSRGESDFSSYVYMCYFNPFETSSECNAIGDLDIYYQDILKDTEVDITAFKKVMNYLDGILEQSDIPNFSILFHAFDPIAEKIDFSVEVNLTKEDEQGLVKKGIKNPNIYILTNIINGLKQSVFVLWADIDAKSITVNSRTITDGTNTYNVKTSSKDFSLPVQKSTEREIFDYINDDFLTQLQELIQKRKEEELLKQQAIEEENQEMTDEESEDWDEFDEEWDDEFEDEENEENEKEEDAEWTDESLENEEISEFDDWDEEWDEEFEESDNNDESNEVKDAFDASEEFVEDEWEDEEDEEIDASENEEHWSWDRNENIQEEYDEENSDIENSDDEDFEWDENEDEWGNEEDDWEDRDEENEDSEDDEDWEDREDWDDDEFNEED